MAFAIGFSTTSKAVTVKGTPSCETWVKDGADKSNRWPVITDVHWLNGYLSSRAVESNIDFMKSTDFESIRLWMDNYCSSIPLDDVYDAADKLGAELRKRMH